VASAKDKLISTNISSVIAWDRDLGFIAVTLEMPTSIFGAIAEEG